MTTSEDQDIAALVRRIEQDYVYLRTKLPYVGAGYSGEMDCVGLRPDGKLDIFEVKRRYSREAAVRAEAQVLRALRFVPLAGQGFVYFGAEAALYEVVGRVRWRAHGYSERRIRDIEDYL